MEPSTYIVTGIVVGASILTSILWNRIKVAKYLNSHELKTPMINWDIPEDKKRKLITKLFLRTKYGIREAHNGWEVIRKIAWMRDTVLSIEPTKDQATVESRSAYEEDRKAYLWAARGCPVYLHGDACAPSSSYDDAY